jgi:hypothetical protein
MKTGTNVLRKKSEKKISARYVANVTDTKRNVEIVELPGTIQSVIIALFFIRKRLSAPGSNDEVVTGEHQRSEFSNDCPIVIGHGGGKTSCHSVVQMFLSSSLMSMS